MNKTYRCFLVLDYKTGKFRVNMKKPSKIKASDIPIDLQLNVVIPEQPTIVAKGELVLSEAKVNQMILEEL